MITTPEEFIALRTSERQEDYLRAATDSAPTTVWFDVIERFPEMRLWVAHNKTIPIEILSRLAWDSDPEVRVAVAMKNKLSEELFILLADDIDDRVRERIAYNKNTPMNILQRLAKDSSEPVSAQALRRMNDGV